MIEKKVKSFLKDKIVCEKYRAIFRDGGTCIARIELYKKCEKNPKHGYIKGRSVGYYTGCGECKIGEKLYKNRNSIPKKST